MRVACVLTVCAALLMSKLISAETAHSNRQVEAAKDDLPEIKAENGINVSEITFTTVRPHMVSTGQRMYLTVYATSHKKYIKPHPSRAMILKLRGRNRFQVNRRRRQLEYPGGKTSGRFEKSYKLSQSHVENHQIETMQGPAEAFDEGAIHIEPIYRITKNKNVLDMIANIFQRIIEPPKSVGPLVGPFHFPGVGDKVYIRLLDTVQPDNLVIRLIMRSPVAEIESQFEKNILPSSEAIKYDIPLASHQFLLPKDELIGSHEQHWDVHSHPPNSSSPSSKDVVKASKFSSQKVSSGRKNGRSKVGSKSVRSLRPVHSLGTYKNVYVHLKQDDLNGVQRVVRLNERHPSLASSANDYINSAPRFQLANKSHDGQRFRSSSVQNSFNPVNISSAEEVARFKSFSSPQMVSSRQIPISNSRQFHSKSNYNESTLGSRKYSIEFTSKKMKYLNMDGSVESAIEESSEKRYKDVELGPIFSNRSIDRQWTPITGVNNYMNEGIASSFSRKEENGNLEERTAEKKKHESAALMAVHLRDATANKTGIMFETEESSYCSQDEDKSNSFKSSFDEQHRETSSAIINNSTSNVENASGIESIVNPMLQLLQLQGAQRILTNSTETKRI
ncbi:uncharacterized protein LOC143432104 [Xylocopa sonorina]|uniref:uncharacterized protein LOC143432104 n=1 Tax=Xylocopa sonorina TaxID=1818115 RepID=UPI00403B3002